MSLRDLHCTNLDRLCRICGNLLGKKSLAKEKYQYNQRFKVLHLPKICVNAVFLRIRSPRKIYSTILHLKQIQTRVPMMIIRTVRMKE